MTDGGMKDDRARPRAAGARAGAPTIGAIVFAAMALAGCRGGAARAPVSAAGPPAPAILETVGDIAIVPLGAGGFENLAPAERAMAYYLARAALPGRDLAYDDGGAGNLEIRDLLEEILTHPRSLDPAFRDLLLEYLKRFWIDNGNHDRVTGAKFVPGFTFEALRAGARAAQTEGAEFRMAVGESLTGKLERLRAAIFDPAFEPAAACPGAAAPGPDAAPDPRRTRRAAALRTITGFLAKAAAFAPAAQRADLGLLSRAVLDGGAAARAARLEGWLGLEPSVDVAIGPGGGCRSGHGREGGWSGLVWSVDAETTRRLRTVAAEGAVAATVLLGTGAAGPATPESLGVPGFDTAAGGGRALLLANVVEAEDRAWLEPLVREFAAREDLALLLKHGRTASFALAALHAVAGHAPAPPRQPEGAPPATAPDAMAPAATASAATASAATARAPTAPDAMPDDDLAVLEEARADLRALGRLFDDRLVAGGLVASRADAEAGLRLYVVRALAVLRAADSEGRLAGAEARAARLVVSWLAARDAGVSETRTDGRTTPRVTDVDAARRGVAALLVEIDRLLSEGGGREAHPFLERFANRADPGMRAEIAGRAAHAGVPSRIAFLMPDLIPVRDAAGEVIDARVGPAADFTLQMLRASGKLPLPADAR